MSRLLSLAGRLGAAIAALCAAHALAADGVLEINQQCALNGGCFPGDAPGFPVTITSSAPARSFRLTGDLGPLGANQTAISVSTNATAIDLGGFRIFGSTQCSVVPVSCAPLGSGVGVLGGSDVVVKNGTIQGMGDDGVRLDYSSRAEGLNLLQNGGDGLSLANESLARGNVITSNGGDGIRCALNCAVHDNTLVGNRFHGIEQLSGTATGNSASNNGARGGQFGEATAFAHNAFANNVAPDVEGGQATGGNFCGDGSCTTHGERRYYLTTSFASGSGALTACAAGFHFASLFELLGVSQLRYDERRGFTRADSGEGPPHFAPGWVRTGNDADGSSTISGLANCNAWTTSTSGFGTWVRLDPQWSDGNPGVYSSDTAPWLPGTSACGGNERVWCVED